MHGEGGLYTCLDDETCCIYVTPSGFVVVQVVLVENTANLPVTRGEFLEDRGFHRRDTDSSLPRAIEYLNEE